MYIKTRNAPGIFLRASSIFTTKANYTSPPLEHIQRTNRTPRTLQEYSYARPLFLQRKQTIPLHPSNTYNAPIEHLERSRNILTRVLYFYNESKLYHPTPRTHTTHQSNTKIKPLHRCLYIIISPMLMEVQRQRTPIQRTAYNILQRICHAMQPLLNSKARKSCIISATRTVLQQQRLLV